MPNPPRIAKADQMPSRRRSWMMDGSAFAVEVMATLRCRFIAFNAGRFIPFNIEAVRLYRNPL
jgi:hypothetical protein